MEQFKSLSLEVVRNRAGEWGWTVLKDSLIWKRVGIVGLGVTKQYTAVCLGINEDGTGSQGERVLLVYRTTFSRPRHVFIVRDCRRVVHEPSFIVYGSDDTSSEYISKNSGENDEWVRVLSGRLEEDFLVVDSPSSGNLPYAQVLNEDAAVERNVRTAIPLSSGQRERQARQHGNPTAASARSALGQGSNPGGTRNLRKSTRAALFWFCCLWVPDVVSYLLFFSVTRAQNSFSDIISGVWNEIQVRYTYAWDPAVQTPFRMLWHEPVRVIRESKGAVSKSIIARRPFVVIPILAVMLMSLISILTRLPAMGRAWRALLSLRVHYLAQGILSVLVLVLFLHDAWAQLLPDGFYYELYFRSVIFGGLLLQSADNGFSKAFRYQSPLTHDEKMLALTGVWLLGLVCPFYMYTNFGEEMIYVCVRFAILLTLLISGLSILGAGIRSPGLQRIGYLPTVAGKAMYERARQNEQLVQTLLWWGLSFGTFTQAYYIGASSKEKEVSLGYSLSVRLLVSLVYCTIRLSDFCVYAWSNVRLVVGAYIGEKLGRLFAEAKSLFHLVYRKLRRCFEALYMFVAPKIVKYVIVPANKFFVEVVLRVVLEKYIWHGFLRRIFVRWRVVFGTGSCIALCAMFSFCLFHAVFGGRDYVSLLIDSIGYALAVHTGAVVGWVIYKHRNSTHVLIRQSDLGLVDFSLWLLIKETAKLVVKVVRRIGQALKKLPDFFNSVLKPLVEQCMRLGSKIFVAPLLWVWKSPYFAFFFSGAVLAIVLIADQTGLELDPVQMYYNCKLLVFQTLSVIFWFPQKMFGVNLAAFGRAVYLPVTFVNEVSSVAASPELYVSPVLAYFIW
eukprot:CAMPEP_0203759256 /NCGR_PEP_ID=MMETSP0098-20131031/12196_1 /ASSEMBLY_ACC=CAM_ASM_000208 /TAXON_ID=96639 /ORGANISM=" , Strain NY0313808BC1" /LENGTH=840 /DNA_ID=CAMNT_0050652075 /DNA_START=239 /DNA_END=2758 /DNA_ORIENTATION=+